MSKEKGAAAMAAYKEQTRARKADADAAAREEAERKRPPVVCLGRLGNQYVFYSTASCNITRLQPKEINWPNLLDIAQREHWERWLFPKETEAGAAPGKRELVAAAQERLLDESRCKLFNPESVRGRGVWADDAGGWLYNAGSCCWWLPAAGGLPERVDNVRGAHVYSLGGAFPFPSDTPLSDKEAGVLLELVSARPWVMQGAGDIMAGWAVAALLAGVMPICPHVWINAPAGTGKTYLKNDIIALLGGFSLAQEGVPTEASIRQRLNGDAIPVLLDEVEQGDNEAAGRNIGKVLDLMRSASYGKDPIAKGSADGTARLFPIKCSFALFSIANCISRDADISRCLVLNLRKYRDDAAGKAARDAVWARQEAGRALLESKGFHGRLMARLLGCLPVITENIMGLSKYLRTVDGADARRAEMFAVLMACRYALVSRGKMSPEQMTEAASLMQAYSVQDEQENDFSRCLGVLLGHVVDVYGRGKVTVVEACRMVRSGGIDERDAAARALAVAGLRWRDDKDALQVDKREEKMKRIYAGTQWANGKIVDVLGEGVDRSKDGTPNDMGIWYGSGKTGGAASSRKCLFLPAALVLGDE